LAPGKATVSELDLVWTADPHALNRGYTSCSPVSRSDE